MPCHPGVADYHHLRKNPASHLRQTKRACVFYSLILV